MYAYSNSFSKYIKIKFILTDEYINAPAASKLWFKRIFTEIFNALVVILIIGTDRAGFLRGREGAGGGAHILRGCTLITISCPDWSNSVRTPRDVHPVRTL